MTGPISKSKAALAKHAKVKPMFEFQNKLPYLPVPKLDSTLQRYVKSVKPLVTEKQFQKTCEAVKAFAAKEGPVLQARLEARAAEPNINNWLEEWWNEIAYFSYRDPVVIYVSYFYVYNNLPSPTKNTRRAAEIVQAALQFRDLVVSEQLTPEATRTGPMCMASYEFMFNATRIPAQPSDFVKTVNPVENDFFVAVRKNRFFVVPLSHSNGSRLSTAELEAQFENIISQAGSTSDPHGVGIYTTQNRDIWFDIRNKMLTSEINKESLDKLEAAAFMVCLDDSSPSSRDEASRACWHGDGYNRFFDKALQFIVFENGVAGFNGEHSRMDGTPTCRLNDYICSSLSNNSVDHGTSNRPVTPPRKLEFELNGDLQKAALEAKSAFDKLIGDHDLKVAAYTGYGSDLIKQFKASPDAYVQMIIQLAFFLLYKRPAATYESGTTRQFVKGRTEVCRTVSEDSVAFTRAMIDPSATPVQRLELAKKAIKTHVAYMSEAVKGMGVDRHLLGLKLSLKSGEETPALFKDPGYSISSHWNMSTSQLSSEHFDGYGWGEVVPDGYGIAYMIKKNSLSFNVAARRPQPGAAEAIVPDVPKMHASLHRAADMLRDIFLPSLPAKL